MAYVVRMPKLGVEMERGEVLEWHVAVGESVEEGDLLAEIESEKSVAEVTARESGTLRRTFLEAGETTEPGGPMGIVAPPEADVSDLEAGIVGEGAIASTGSETGTPGSPPGEARGDDGSSPIHDESGGTTVDEAAAGGSADVKATPKAKRRASELDVTLTRVEGTGPQGSVTASDVERAADRDDRPSTSPAPRTLTDASELGPTRRTIADRLGRSYREAVHVTVHREVDAEALLDTVEREDARLEPDVGLLDVLLVALSATLAEHTAFNATFEDGDHRTYEEHNVGIAVDADGGLLTPVIGDVGGRSLADVATERRVTTERVLAGDHDADDLTGGTFTVSNLGVLGVDAFTPIINPPQVAVLGVSRTGVRATETDGSVALRKVLPLDLSFDHRVVDGADAARFLDTLATHLRTPEDLFE